MSVLLTWLPFELVHVTVYRQVVFSYARAREPDLDARPPQITMRRTS